MVLDYLANTTKGYGGNMLGHSVFTYRESTNVNYLTTVTRQEYLDWQKLYTMDGLQGIRYGQSFCNHFELTDNLLYYTADPEWCDSYIRKTYVERP